MKYEHWQIPAAPEDAIKTLMDAGYPYLVSSVLAARGVQTSEQAAEAQTNRRQHGNQRVLKRMTIGNHALRHAAGTRRADIILMDNVQHRAARGARNAADCLQAKGGNRENSSLPCIHADTWQPP